MILGSGETEKIAERAVEDAIRSFVSTSLQTGKEAHYFSDEFITEIRNGVALMSKESLERGEEYKNAGDYPGRYYYFWASIIGDANYLVFILEFHHIDRRQVFSPDGWGMMKSEVVFYIKH